MPLPKYYPEGPDVDQNRILGVEMASSTNGGREVELEMFQTKITLPDGWRIPVEMRITVHTTAGDVTVRFPLRPGDYRAY